VFAPGGLLFPTAPDEGRCFTALAGTSGSDETGGGRHAFVVVRRYGSGLVIGLGDNHVMTNRYLRFADNAGLVTSLLAPTPGAKVRIMLGTAAPPSPQDIGKGDETLGDLVRPGVWMGLTQLALAFIVFCIARGIRPGRAVREPQPTPIAGNELAVATGNLMQRAHHFGRAGSLIRGEFQRQLCAHHRLPPDTSIDRLAELVAQRSEVPQAWMIDVLQRTVANAPDLHRLRIDIEWMRERTITSPSTITPPSTRIPERA